MKIIALALTILLLTSCINNPNSNADTSLPVFTDIINGKIEEYDYSYSLPGNLIDDGRLISYSKTFTFLNEGTHKGYFYVYPASCKNSNDPMDNLVVGGVFAFNYTVANNSNYSSLHIKHFALSLIDSDYDCCELTLITPDNSITTLDLSSETFIEIPLDYIVTSPSNQVNYLNFKLNGSVDYENTNTEFSISF